jgi:cell division protein FtsL
MMTINDIMLRDIMEAEKKEQEREAAAAERKAKTGDALVKWAERVFVVLAVATILFLIWCIVSDTPHRRGGFGRHEVSAERGCDPSK